MDVGTWKTLLKIYGNVGLSEQPTEVLLDDRNRDSLEATVDFINFRVSFDNLLRLGLLREDQTNSHARPLIHLTALGYDFVLACRPPQL